MSEHTAIIFVGPLGFATELDRDGELEVGDREATWGWIDKEQAIEIVNILIDRFKLTKGKPNAD